MRGNGTVWRALKTTRRAYLARTHAARPVVGVLGRSDERYVIAGGSGALVAALAERVMSRIVTDRRLARIDPPGAGVRLVSAGEATFDAATVIVTTPASVTRTIDVRTDLPPLWRRLLAEVGLGANVKVQAEMMARPWGTAVGSGHETRQRDHRRRVEGREGTVRVGPGPAVAADASEPVGSARGYARGVEPGIAGMTATTGHFARRRNGRRNPLAKGAYVDFRPGQFARFGRLLRAEVDGVARAPLASRPILFAGGHWSDADPGYRNGGAQTGRLAAQTVIAARAAARRAR